MKTNGTLVTIICIVLTSCQSVATPTILTSPTKTNPTLTPVSTTTSQPIVAVSATITPTSNSNLEYWNGLQFDTRKWTTITYNDTEWTPKTYPVHTLEPVLTHNFIENCMIYLEEGHGLPADWTYREVPIIIGGHIIFDERIFSDESGQEVFLTIVGAYHVDFPQNDHKSACIKDAARVVMMGMRGGCTSEKCGYCPGLPATNLKIVDQVKLVHPQMNLPVTEPGVDNSAGNKSDWYFSDEMYALEVIGGPVCVNENAWWQLRSPNDITGWDSDDHFIVEP